MTHIMIVSANGSEAKALFYLLQRAGLGAVDLSICPGEHLARLVAERGAGVILAEAEALGDKPEQVLDELFRVASECQVVLYSGNTVQMDALRTLKRDNVQMLMRPLRKTQIQRAVARALEQAGHGPRQAQCEQLLRIMTQRTLDDLLEGRTEEACKSLNALGLEQECGAVYLAWLSEPLALRESENLAAELRGRLLGVGCTALLRVSGGSLAAVGFAPADQQAAVMGTLETALKRYCFEHERKHQLSSAPFDSLEELPEALQQAAAGLGPRVGWAEPLLQPQEGGLAAAGAAGDAGSGGAGAPVHTGAFLRGDQPGKHCCRLRNEQVLPVPCVQGEHGRVGVQLPHLAAHGGSPPPAGHHHPEGVAGGQPGGLRRPQLFHHGLQKAGGRYAHRIPGRADRAPPERGVTGFAAVTRRWGAKCERAGGQTGISRLFRQEDCLPAAAREPETGSRPAESPVSNFPIVLPSLEQSRPASIG